MDDALRRAEAYRAGAKMLFVPARKADQFRYLGERLPPPVMAMLTERAQSHGYHQDGSRRARLSAVRRSGHAAVSAASHIVAVLSGDRERDPTAPFGSDSVMGEQKLLHETIALDAMLAIERGTVEQ